MKSLQTCIQDDRGHRILRSDVLRLAVAAGLALCAGACAHLNAGTADLRQTAASASTESHERHVPGAIDRAGGPVAIPSVPVNPDRPLVVLGVELENTDFDIPVRVNSQVEHWVSYFTGRGRELFGRYLERSEYFIPYIRSILEENGMPQDLVYLAMIESGFNNHARSRARAVGPWQFMSATGKRYGLRVDWWVDERRDIQKSTLSAIHYLADLHRIFGSWELAWSAYNAGESKVSRAIRRFGTLDFWAIARHRFLRPETRNYVPKLMAAAIVSKNRTQFGFPPSQRVYVKPNEVLASDGSVVELKDAGGGATAGTESDESATAQLESLPTFLTEYEDEYHENGLQAAVLVTRLPDEAESSELETGLIGAEDADAEVAAETAEEIAASEEGVPESAPEPSVITPEEETAIRFASSSRFRAGWDGPPRAPAFAREIPTPHLSKRGEIAGETLLEFEVQSPADLLRVARAAGMSYETVRSLNPELRQWCTPPDGSTYRIKLPEMVKERFLLTYNHPAFPREIRFKKYKVRKGDSVPGIARRFRVDQQVIKELNAIGPGNPLRAGRMIELPLPNDRREVVSSIDGDVSPKKSKVRTRRAARRASAAAPAL